MTRIKRGYIARRRRTKIRLFASSFVVKEGPLYFLKVFRTNLLKKDPVGFASQIRKSFCSGES